MHQIQTQKGEKEQFVRALNGYTPLFNNVTVSSSGDYGLYYSVPYTNSANEVEGCIIYPVDTNLPMEQRRISGTLGTLVNMDREFLNEKVDLSTRYLYSAAFLNWQNNGLSVNSRLTTHAKLLNEGPIFANTQGQISRASNDPYIYGKRAFVEVRFSLSSTGYVISPQEYGIMTLSDSTVNKCFDKYLYYCSDLMFHDVDSHTRPWCTLLLLDFAQDHNADYVFKIVSKVIQDIVDDVCMNYHINFHAASVDVYFSDGHRVSSGGENSSVGGGTYYDGVSGGNQGNDGNGNSGNDVDYPKAGIYENCSLNEADKKLFNKVIKELFTQRCGFRYMSDILSALHGGFSDVQYRDMSSTGQYDPKKNIFYVSKDILLIREGFPEEYIHMFQNFIYQGTYKYAGAVGSTNIDFEAKFIRDITCVMMNAGGCDYGQGKNYSMQYQTWVYQLAEMGGRLTKDIINKGYTYNDAGVTKTLYYEDFLNDFAKRFDNSPQNINYSSSHILQGLRTAALDIVVSNLSCN